MLDRRLKKFLEKYTLTELKEEYVLKEELLYQSNISNGILKGFYFERSLHDKNGFYLWAFVQPLFIPSKNIILTFGKRLVTSENSEWWSFNFSNISVSESEYLDLNRVIAKEGINYLREVGTLSMFYNYFRSKKTQNIRIYEAIIYTLFLTGNNEAFGEASLFLDYIKRTQNCSIKWINEVVTNMESLLIAEPTEIKHRLEEWELETLNNLKI